MPIIKEFLERDSTIVDICRGKSVLHLGCVGFTDCATDEKVRQANDSLHSAIGKVSHDCTGVDLDGDTIRELRDHGVFLNVIEGNVEHLDQLPTEYSRFDLVVAGDIIEHLSNPGLMLDGIRNRLGASGKLLVSTPNAFGVASWIRVLTGRFSEGAQHVLCFNPITLEQLLTRHGYEVQFAATCYQSRARGNFGSWFGFLRWLLQRFPILGGTLLFVCKVKNDSDSDA